TGAVAKPNCIITSDSKSFTISTDETVSKKKKTQFSCKPGEKFEETTDDGRKTVCKFTNGALVQDKEWDGKENTMRKVIMVDCLMNNVTCTQIYENV
uniref:Uncharacterized protein n=1 Tax=Prolemur simus TaxID=1328070 RepID=A0A8C9AWM3_PROSS